VAEHPATAGIGEEIVAAWGGGGSGLVWGIFGFHFVLALIEIWHQLFGGACGGGAL
jgi:hypothetical protein